MSVGLGEIVTKVHYRLGCVCGAGCVSVVLACLTACGSGSVHQQIESMAWLETADPVVMLRDSLAAHRVHFLQVCGISCFTPGVGLLTYEHCYKTAADIKTIDPTGDVIVSDRQDHLKRLAWRFANRYNQLLVKALDSRGARACPETEQWDSLWTALNDIARQLPREPNESFVMALPPGPAQFQLHVQKAQYLARDLYAQMCRAATAHGIHGRVVFQVTSGNINDHPHTHNGFTCRDGRLLQ